MKVQLKYNNLIIVLSIYLFFMSCEEPKILDPEPFDLYELYRVKNGIKEQKKYCDPEYRIENNKLYIIGDGNLCEIRTYTRNGYLKSKKKWYINKYPEPHDIEQTFYFEFEKPVKSVYKDMTAFYNKNSFLKKKEPHIQIEEIKYDSKGNVVYYSLMSKDSPSRNIQEYIEYDKYNREVKRISLQKFALYSIDSSITEFRYNRKNQVILERKYDLYDNLIYKKIFKYNHSGEVEVEKKYDNKNNLIDKKYNEQGDNILYEKKNINGDIIESHYKNGDKYIRRYENSKILYEAKLNKHGDIIYSFSYDYDDYGNEVKFTKILTIPHYIKETTFRKYDEFGSCIEAFKIDKNGKVISISRYEYIYY